MADMVELRRQALRLLKDVSNIRDYQDRPSIANQGQCLDGYSALANYNDIAEKIAKFLSENELLKE